MIVSSLREGARVETEIDGRFRIDVDQPAPYGADSAPSPFDVFLAGIAACTAYYAQVYCRKWKLPHQGIRVALTPVFDKAHRLTDVSMHLHVPDNFPAEHRDGLLRNAGNCLVKKTLESPPAIKLVLAVDAVVAA
ncbi:MAG TPA: OsmC family protein [Rhodocyclaceae bacterium]